MMLPIEWRKLFLRYPWFATLILLFVINTNYRFEWFITCSYNGKKSILDCFIMFIYLGIYEMLFRFGSLFVSWYILLPFITMYYESFSLPVMFLDHLKQNATKILVEASKVGPFDVVNQPLRRKRDK